MLPPRCPRAERPCDFFSEHSQHERSMRDARCGGQTRALSRARRAIWLGGYEDYNNVSVCKATSGAPRNYPTAPQRNIRFHHVLSAHVLPSVLQYVFQDKSLFWRFCILLPLPFHNSPLLPHLVYYL